MSEYQRVGRAVRAIRGTQKRRVGRALRLLAVHQGKRSRFQAKLDDVCNRHQKKRGLIDRIKRAGLQ
jgi:oligoribonuclease (3'-5' exoribonuclease)